MVHINTVIYICRLFSLTACSDPGIVFAVNPDAGKNSSGEMIQNKIVMMNDDENHDDNDNDDHSDDYVGNY